MLESFANKMEGVEKKETESTNKKFDPDRRFDIQKPFNELKSKIQELDHDKRIEIKGNEIKSNCIQNKLDGTGREEVVQKELQKKYPEKKGFQVIRESYLRNKDGEIVKDKVTNTARRLDFVVTNGDKVVDMVEVTSKTAPKIDQLSKEFRIRQDGGNYIKDDNGKLIKIPNNIETHVERRD